MFSTTSQWSSQSVLSVRPHMPVHIRPDAVPCGSSRKSTRPLQLSVLCPHSQRPWHPSEALVPRPVAIGLPSLFRRAPQSGWGRGNTVGGFHHNPSVGGKPFPDENRVVKADIVPHYNVIGQVSHDQHSSIIRYVMYCTNILYTASTNAKRLLSTTSNAL